MARKPKLPRPGAKQPQGFLGNLKDSSRKAISSSLTRNFGVLGSAVARTALAKPKTTKTNPDSPEITEKALKAKKLRQEKTSGALADSAKQVTNAIDSVTLTTNITYARVTRQVSVMGDDVARAMDDLNSALDQLLYRQTNEPPPTQPSRPMEVVTNDNQPEENKPSIRPKTKSRFRPKSPTKIGGKLGRLRGLLGMPGLRTMFGTALEGMASYDEYQQDGNAARAGAGFAGGMSGMIAGGAAGAAIGSIIPGIGTIGGGFIGGLLGASAGSSVGREVGHTAYDLMADPNTPQKSVGSKSNPANKLTFTADKITFDVKNTIEFKNRKPDRDGGDTKASPKPYAGFFNSIIDRVRGGAGGAGSLNTASDAVRGGQGGVGSFNTFADTVRGGPGRSATSGGPVSTSTTPKSGSNTKVSDKTLAELASSGMKPTEYAVEKALKLEGMHEGSDRAKIKEYLRTGGVNMDPATTAWCAATINSSLAQAGIKGTNSNIANSFQRWGMPVTDATKVEKGDVLLKSRGKGPDQTGGHVGFATGRTDPKTGKIEMYAGNDGNKARRTWADPKEHGFMIRRATEKELPKTDAIAAAKDKAATDIKPAEPATPPPGAFVAPQPPIQHLTPPMPSTPSPSIAPDSNEAITPKRDKVSSYIGSGNYDDRPTRVKDEGDSYSQYLGTVNGGDYA